VSDHPFRQAWETRRLSLLSDRFAPDIRLNSPLTTSPFEGREVAIRLYEVLFEEIHELSFTHEFSEGNAHVFFWSAKLGGRDIEGMDLLTEDAGGLITEITVMTRPIASTAAFASTAGPRMARRHGRLRAGLVAALARPLPGLLSAGDRAVMRLADPNGE
jgi:hypothetical protein